MDLGGPATRSDRAVEALGSVRAYGRCDKHQGAALGGFAEGWREIGQGLHGFKTCLDDHVLLRWELDEIEAENIAMGAGDRMEPAFGTTHRRHLASRGEYADRFDRRFGY